MNYCTYCGESAEDRDHVIPVSYTHNIRVFAGTDWVWACKQCNNILSNHMFTTIETRAAYLLGVYEKKLKKLINFVNWEDWELEDMSTKLQRSILARMKQKKIAVERLDHLRRISRSE